MQANRSSITTLTGVEACRAHGKTYPGNAGQQIRCGYCHAARGLEVPAIATAATVPNSARLERTIRGTYTLKSGEQVTVVASLWTGTASHGYKTDYQHKGAAWIVTARSHVLPFNRDVDVYRYTGKRLALVASEMDSLAAQVAA